MSDPGPNPNPDATASAPPRAPRLDTASGTVTAPPGEPAAAAPVPARVGGFVVLGELGRGGMGVVYRAEDPTLKREVAIKVMLPQYAANPQAKARFVREARAQAKVEHDHVAVIHAVGDPDGIPYLVMPLLQGMTLADALKANPRPPLAEVVRIAREIADGLAAAHAKGLVHRDIKPANIWLEGRKLRVKVLDFGLARTADETEVALGGPTDPGDGPLTRTGAVVGTPAYMSPEQARGLPVDARTDLFSLGMVVYKMTTGVLPSPNTSAEPVVPPAEKNPAVPPSLSALVTRLLARDPAGRPASAEALADELRAVEAELSAAVRVIALGDVPPPIVLGPTGPDPFANLDETEASTPAAPPRAGGVCDRSSRRRGFTVWATVLGVLLAVGLLTGFAVRQMGKKLPEVVHEDPTPKPVPPAVPKDEPPIPGPPRVVTSALFSGRDLTGWTQTGRQWRVADGAIVCTRVGDVGTTTTLTSEQRFADFEFSFRGRLPPCPTAQIALTYRYQPGNGAARTGTGRVVIRHSNVSHLVGGKLFGKPVPPRAGDFNDVTVRCVGRSVTIRANGETVYHGEPDVPAAGQFMFQGYDLTGDITIRDIRFRDLSKLQPDPTFFNGKSLAGWTQARPDWQVVNGALVGSRPQDAAGVVALHTEKSFADFEFSCRIRTLGNDAAALVYRRRFVDNIWKYGQISIRPGGIAHDGVNGPSAPFNPGGSNELRVRCVGRWVTVTANGVVLRNEESDVPAEGQFVLKSLTTTAGHIIIEDIQFTDLNQPPPDPTFFNGKDLTGWQGKPDHWRVENGEIVGAFPAAGKRQSTFLSTAKSYADFELSFRARLTGAVANSGLTFRGKRVGTHIVDGVHCDMTTKLWGRVSLAAGKPSVAGPDAATANRLLRPNDYNDVTVRCVGRRVSVVLNGEVVADDELDIPADGYIGWQLPVTSAPEEVRIRDIVFTDLGAAKKP